MALKCFLLILSVGVAVVSSQISCPAGQYVGTYGGCSGENLLCFAGFSDCIFGIFWWVLVVCYELPFTVGPCL